MYVKFVKGIWCEVYTKKALPHTVVNGLMHVKFIISDSAKWVILKDITAYIVVSALLHVMFAFRPTI
jgi:hypothetical protein